MELVKYLDYYEKVPSMPCTSVRQQIADDFVAITAAASERNSSKYPQPTFMLR